MTYELTETKQLTKQDLDFYKLTNSKKVNRSEHQYIRAENGSFVNAPKPNSIVSVSVFLHEHDNFEVFIRASTADVRSIRLADQIKKHLDLATKYSNYDKICFTKFSILYDSTAKNNENKIQKCLELIAPYRNEDDYLELIQLTREKTADSSLPNEVTAQFNTHSFMSYKSNNYAHEYDTHHSYSYAIDLYEHRYDIRPINIRTQLQAIKLKSKKFKNQGNTIAAEVAVTLYNDLKTAFNSYMINPKSKENIDVFIEASKKAIAAARPELENHRGWKEMLGNLGFCILGLGIGYLAVCAYRGSFFKFNTDSVDKLNQLQNSIVAVTLD